MYHSLALPVALLWVSLIIQLMVIRLKEKRICRQDKLIKEMGDALRRFIQQTEPAQPQAGEEGR
jgi:uncharacterized membrane-anchored protein YhcB (DUF1043 family)